MPKEILPYFLLYDLLSPKEICLRLVNNLTLANLVNLPKMKCHKVWLANKQTPLYTAGNYEFP